VNEYQKMQRKQAVDTVMLIMFIVAIIALAAIIIKTIYNHYGNDTSPIRESYEHDTPPVDAASYSVVYWFEDDAPTVQMPAPHPPSLTPAEIEEQATEATTEVKATYTYDLTDYEKSLLYFMSDGEGGYSIEARQACIEVCLNRTYHSDKFKQTTISEILFAPKQFQTMHKYPENYVPTAEAVEALERILRGEKILDETVLYFSASYVPASKIARGLVFYGEYGGNFFYQQN